MAGQCWNAGCGEAASRFRGGGWRLGGVVRAGMTHGCCAGEFDLVAVR